MYWEIYYSNGSTFSIDDGPLEYAKRDDVQVVIENYDGKNIIHSLREWYWFDQGQWDCGSNVGQIPKTSFKFESGKEMALEDFKKMREGCIECLLSQ